MYHWDFYTVAQSFDLFLIGLWTTFLYTVGSILIGIETSTPGNLDLICQRLDAHGIGYRDITRDPVLAEFLI